MSSPNQDWYGHLVAQSKTDAIYTLIHTHLTPDWEPNHDLDFVVVRQNALPQPLRDIPSKHISRKLKKEDYCFPGEDYVLLHNYQLTDYLHAAQWACIVEDFQERSFIELRFDWTNEAEENWQHPPAYQYAAPPKRDTAPSDAQRLPPESEEETALIYAYQLLRDATNKELALSYARTGKAFLDSQLIEVDLTSELALQKIERRMLGYNIVAMVAVWNEAMDLASSADAQYLHHPAVWDKLDVYIRNYLELLMIKGQSYYLEVAFASPDFRQRFLAHYEAYVSLFVNSDYPLTTMMEVVGIINRVNNDTNYR